MTATTREQRRLAPAALADRKLVLGVMSFVIPFLIWCLVSYVPFIWHPMVAVSDPGAVGYFTPGMLVEQDVSLREREQVRAAGGRSRGASRPTRSICRPRIRWRARFTPPSPPGRNGVTRSGCTRVWPTASA